MDWAAGRIIGESGRETESERDLPYYMAVTSSWSDTSEKEKAGPDRLFNDRRTRAEIEATLKRL